MVSLVQDWRAVGHALETTDLVVRVVAFALAAVFVGWIAVAATRSRRYRSTRALADADRARIRAALAAAERASEAELAVVVVERSDSHPHAEWLAALVAMAIGSTAAASELLGAHPAYLGAANVVFGAIGFFAARALPAFKRGFVTGRRAEEMAREQAIQEFAALALHRTRGRTGVLIFVSLFERCVIVLGDEAIHARIGDAGWLEVDALVLDRVREGALADGLIAGVERVGAVLARHFPAEHDAPNELPDHLIVRES